MLEFEYIGRLWFLILVPLAVFLFEVSEATQHSEVHFSARIWRESATLRVDSIVTIERILGVDPVADHKVIGFREID